MSDMVEVMIDSVRISLTSQQRIVLLRRLDADVYLPIWVGPFEAEAITIALQEVEFARPQTHDLYLQTLASLEARLARVEVVSLKEDVFYGSLIIEREGQTIEIDARPSDSIALAVRAHVPIFVADEIFTTAGIKVERDIQSEAAEEQEAAAANAPQDPEMKKRLSVYEDFLQNLDIGDESHPSDDEPKPPDSPEPPTNN